MKKSPSLQRNPKAREILDCLDASAAAIGELLLSRPPRRDLDAALRRLVTETMLPMLRRAGRRGEG